MDAQVTYELMMPGEEVEVSELVARVFDEYVAADCTLEGIQEFLGYIAPDLMAVRSQAGHFAWVAKVKGKIVGMIEMRNDEHISLLFVDKGYQGRGISRGLFERAMVRSLKAEPDVREISVNSSSYAVGVYERLGFERCGPKERKNGISYIPMKLRKAL